MMTTSRFRFSAGRRLTAVLTGGCAIALLATMGGCVRVPVHAQAQVSRPGMTFSQSLVETQRFNLVSQLEPGSAVSGGAQAAGCTACR